MGSHKVVATTDINGQAPPTGTGKRWPQGHTVSLSAVHGLFFAWFDDLALNRGQVALGLIGKPFVSRWGKWYSPRDKGAMALIRSQTIAGTCHLPGRDITHMGYAAITRTGNRLQPLNSA